MSYSELLPKQIEEMEMWISSAFKRYLERDIHETTELLPPEAVNRFVEDRRSYNQRYGDEFRRVCMAMFRFVMVSTCQNCAQICIS